ncbi:hypothetical protein Q9X96_003113 [Vibrio vulnificus]|nr:hypothetical protein [Vibrio vulnificus]ELH4810080.1 hypothetical protein [Vibrio vulnificus]
MTKQEFNNLIKEKLSTVTLDKDHYATLTEQIKISHMLFDLEESVVRNSFLIRSLNDIKNTIASAYVMHEVEAMFK